MGLRMKSLNPEDGVHQSGALLPRKGVKRIGASTMPNLAINPSVGSVVPCDAQRNRLARHLNTSVASAPP